MTDSTDDVSGTDTTSAATDATTADTTDGGGQAAGPTPDPTTDSAPASGGAPVVSLADFLQSADVGVESSGDGLHIGVAFLEALHTSLDIAEVATPPLVVEGASTGVAATIGGLSLAVTGPVLGMAGVFMALGAGYEEARELIRNEALASGFSQGFVCGILNMSATSVSSIFGRHGVIPHNAADPDADVIEANAYNRGLVAGYTMANLASPDEKKSFVFEIRKYTGDVPVGDWTDLDKRNYVIEYAAKLRLNFLHA